MIALTSDRWRWACWSGATTVAFVAANPFRLTRSISSSIGKSSDARAARIASAGTPASMTAPRTMSPLMPLKQSK